jgi:hypothetical protein
MVDDYFYLENNLIDIKLTISKKNIKKTEINLLKVDSIVGNETEEIRSDFKVFENRFENDHDWKSKLFIKLNTIIKENPSNNYSGFL